MDLRKLHSDSKNDRGAAMLEYALMAACIAVVAMTAVGYVGEETSKTFNDVSEAVAGSVFPGDGNQPPQDGI
jgi:pilus assembly protein Flp/PilA